MIWAGIGLIVGGNALFDWMERYANSETPPKRVETEARKEYIEEKKEVIEKQIVELEEKLLNCEAEEHMLAAREERQKRNGGPPKLRVVK
jgi:hypothetical protein